MNLNIKPSAELFVATGCSHCPIVLKELSEQLKKGQLASLLITNIAVDNEKAAELGIRSVPWFSLTNENSFMIFSGNHTPKEIQKWLSVSEEKDGMQEYIDEYLNNGQMMTITQAIHIKPEIFTHVIAMLEDEETGMNTRIGLDALLENFASTKILQKQISSLKKIASSKSTRLKIDALHYIALTADVKNKSFLEKLTTDEDVQVKEAATEALETLEDLLE